MQYSRIIRILRLVNFLIWDSVTAAEGRLFFHGIIFIWFFGVARSRRFRSGSVPQPIAMIAHILVFRVYERRARPHGWAFLFDFPHILEYLC